MTPDRRRNLQRLLQPASVAIIGGRDAITVIGECRRIGYTGHIWPVNPKREELAGLRCFKDVEELPEAPDAVFLAIPADRAVPVVAKLASMGAGGVVCYTAGFGEDGREGGESDRSVVEAAGDMALVGPNCYGLINYLDRVALWPFPHGGYCPGYGAAIITQSGMLSSDITMNQRHLPLAYMVSAGNQSVLQLEDYIEVLSRRDEVRAIGLHIEGLKDTARFSHVARKALELGKPLVVLKTGSSLLGGELTVSHTGSLAGVHEYYLALFERLGIIHVNSPAQLVETLKFLCISGVPEGTRVLAFTCSGGGATMLADHAEPRALHFPAPTEPTRDALVDLLPRTADVTNPLDYTTPIWGIPERVEPVFARAMEDRYDATLIVQDYPLSGLDDSKHCYTSDAACFARTARDAGLPAAVVSTLPENIDPETREVLIGQNVTPLQGLPEAIAAVDAAAWYGQQRRLVRRRGTVELVSTPQGKGRVQIDEAAAKALLADAGFPVPPGKLAGPDNVSVVGNALGYPVVLKLNSAVVAHKTEIGAVHAGIGDADQLTAALAKMRAALAGPRPELAEGPFLVEKMADAPVIELLLGIRRDDLFGYALTISPGGVLAELIDEAVTLLLPSSAQEILAALRSASWYRLLEGYRGRPTVDCKVLCQAIWRLCHHVIESRGEIVELEINPLFVYPAGICVVDALMVRAADGESS